uniref:Uncharacterized protein n=1 Tax=Rhizophora mucronata TaxID=61149 RepID=A0A2P2QDG6_RHIMU
MLQDVALVMEISLSNSFLNCTTGYVRCTHNIQVT